MILHFRASGTPVPQGSKTVAQHGGRAWVRDANAGKLKPWRENVANAARVSHEGARLDGHLSVDMLFLLPRPTSVVRPYPSVKPDLDKLVRAVMDGITDANVWADDARVVELWTAKAYAADGDTPGVIVYVTPTAPDAVDAWHLKNRGVA